MRETLEETGIDLGEQRPVACHKLSAGEYYFYEMDDEPHPRTRDWREVEETRWMSLEEAAACSCNVDVSCFLSRMDRRFRRTRQ